MRSLLNKFIPVFSAAVCLWGCSAKPQPEDPVDPQPLDTVVVDKEGYSVKGLVYEGDSPVAGAVVSDGVNVTTTNLSGKYWLKTDSKSDFVFISIPSGYEVKAMNTNRPLFYRRFNPSATQTQRFDFELVKVQQESYALVVLADVHVCGRTTRVGVDSALVRDVCVPDIMNFKNSLPSDKRCYGLVLGDMVQDTYIPEGGYEGCQAGFEDYFGAIRAIDFPMFHVIGNHDHLPNAPVARDEDARELKEYYMSHCGPGYYSFNLGKVHYVVLDNCQMLGGGTNNCLNHLTARQMAWLEKDLAKTDTGMKLVFCCHLPIFRNLESEIFKVVGAMDNYPALDNLCKAAGFTNYEIFSGHSHFAEMVEVFNGRVLQTVHPSVCGVWWLSKLCHDGTPAAYTVYNVNGSSMERRLMAYNDPDKAQFTIHRDAQDTSGNHIIQLNVPFYSSSWRIKVMEDSHDCSNSLKREYVTDWYYTTKEFPDMPDKKYSTVIPMENWHMLDYYPTNAESVVKIEIKDSFGNEYREILN